MSDNDYPSIGSIGGHLAHLKRYRSTGAAVRNDGPVECLNDESTDYSPPPSLDTSKISESFKE